MGLDGGPLGIVQDAERVRLQQLVCDLVVHLRLDLQEAP
jgi:hypothetical protein